MSETPRKCIKRKALSIKDKVDIIRKVESSALSRVALAKELGMPPSTLNGIVAKKEEILASAGNTSANCKKMKTGKYDDVEQALLVWFKQQRSLNIPLSGTIVKEKAEEIACRLQVPFNASNGWLDRFKNRAGIVYKTISGEAASVNTEETEAWKETLLPSKISNYKPSDIFNVDEFGLFYQVVPDKSLVMKGESCLGGKLSKVRATVLVGSNMDGTEKLPLLMIGKSRKPRCLKNVRTLPCNYKSNKSAWMTSSLFEDYMQALDAKMGSQNRKIVVFMDHCPAHPKEWPHLRNITIEFFPPNTTSVLQPMDQGVIKVLKQRYRKTVVCRMLSRMEAGGPVYKPSLLDAMHLIASSWYSIESTIIENCFKKAGFVSGTSADTSITTEDCDEEPEWWKTVQEKMEITSSFSEFTAVDDKVVTCEEQTIDEICREIQVRNDEDDNEEEDGEEEEENSPRPSCSDASVHLGHLKRFLEGAASVPQSTWKAVWELEKFVQQESSKKLKQSTLDNFFSK